MATMVCSRCESRGFIVTGRKRIAVCPECNGEGRQVLPMQLSGLTNFLAALAEYARHQIVLDAASAFLSPGFLTDLATYIAIKCDERNRYIPEVCDHRAAWWLGFAERRLLAEDQLQYRSALRRVIHYQAGARLGRETGRPVAQIETGTKWRVIEPTPAELLAASDITPDDARFEYLFNSAYETWRLQL